LLASKLGDSQLNQLLHEMRKGFFTELVVEGLLSHIIFFSQTHTIELTVQVSNSMAVTFAQRRYQAWDQLFRQNRAISLNKTRAFCRFLKNVSIEELHKLLF
jgi:hypothetical protein